MIYIVHGNDYAKSRRLIVNQQKHYPESIKREINISEATPKEFYETVATKDIFSIAPYVVLNLDQKITNTNAYIEILKKTPQDTPLIILSPTGLSKSNEFIKNATNLKAKIIQNDRDEKANIFKFVDFVWNKQEKQAINELNALLNEDNDFFYIFAMLLNGLRNILHAKFNTPSFQKKSDFVKRKSQSQAQKYSKQDLQKVFNIMHEVDLKIKTGEMSQDTFLIYTLERIFEI